MSASLVLNPPPALPFPSHGTLGSLILWTLSHVSLWLHNGNSELTLGRQHFNKKIWRDVVEKRGELGSPAKTASPATPKKRGGRKKAKSQETAVDSDTDLSETPSKKRKVSAKKGADDDEDDQYHLKKEVKKESI